MSLSFSKIVSLLGRFILGRASIVVHALLQVQDWHLLVARYYQNTGFHKQVKMAFEMEYYYTAENSI